MGVSARNAAVQFNGYAVTGYLDEYDAETKISLLEDTRFGAAVEAKAWFPDLFECALTLSGFWDGAVDAISDILNDVLGTVATQNAAVWPVGDAVGSDGFVCTARQASKKVTAKIGSLVRLVAELKGDGTRIEAVKSLHSHATTETLAGNGVTVDNLAATTNGGAIHVQVDDVGAAFTLTVRHSTDNFGANDVLLGSFTVNPSDKTSQRVAIAGTINRYTRCVWTLTGNAKFGCSLYRKP